MTRGQYIYCSWTVDQPPSPCYVFCSCISWFYGLSYIYGFTRPPSLLPFQDRLFHFFSLIFIITHSPPQTCLRTVLLPVLKLTVFSPVLPKSFYWVWFRTSISDYTNTLSLLGQTNSMLHGDHYTCIPSYLFILWYPETLGSFSQIVSWPRVTT